MRYIPKLCRHKASGRAYVTDPATRRPVYLGAWGAPETDQAYDQWVREFLSREAPRTPRQGRATVEQLADAYLDWADTYYRKGGKPTSQVSIIKGALRRLIKSYGSLPVDTFGPGQLKALRQGMIEEGRLARSTINKLVRELVRLWRWGVEHSLADAATLQALKAVRGLPRGRSAARETPAVRPVAAAVVERTLPCLRPVPRAMVQLQQLTGMRPGEVCPLRPCDVDRSREPWVYVPPAHKTEHHGKQRRIYLGPQARQLLAPFLERCPRPGNWLFPSGGAHGCYSEDSYAGAIESAARRAGVPHWSPNQLRHQAGTRIRAAHGLEGAQAILGHSEVSTTQIYAERSDELARKVAEDLG